MAPVFGVMPCWFSTTLCEVKHVGLPGGGEVGPRALPPTFEGMALSYRGNRVGEERLGGGGGAPD